MHLLSNSCMPGYLLGAETGAIFDAQYTDFDEQAERLTGYDQSYLQLTPGPFQGRFLSGVFGPDVSVHIEHCNRALEQTVAGNDSAFTLGVLVNETAPYRVNGRVLSASDVLISSPGGSLFVHSPEDGAILALVLDETAFCAHPGLSDAARDWLCAPNAPTRILNAPQLARRIREDTVQALQSACFDAEPNTAIPLIGEALVAGVAAKLSLEIAGRPNGPDRVRASEFQRFHACREMIHAHWQDIRSMDNLMTIVGGGRRALQGAFAHQIEVGPLGYHRLLRLHLAKEALLDPAKADLSIGDIAARFEFWSWSHFTSQYQAHFGELPSQTRRALGARA